MTRSLLENLKLIYNSFYRNELNGGEEMMRDNELVIKFVAPQGINLRNYPTTVINELFGEVADKLIKRSGGTLKTWEDATYELAGTTHNVPIKTAA